MTRTSSTPSRWTWLGRAVGVGAVATVLAGGSVLPAAHASPARASTTVTLWGPYSGPDQGGVKNIVSGFNSSQSTYNVAYDEQSQTSYGQKLTTALSANKGPDMWVTDNTGMTGFADQGVLQPLEGPMKSFKDLTAKNFGKGILAGGRYNGHQYAIPLDVLPLTLYYNKAMLKKAGYSKPPVQDLKTFLAAAKKMTKGGKWGFVVAPAWPEPFIYQSLIAQFGGKVFDVKNAKATVNSKAGVQALQLLRDMIYKYKISPPNTAPDQNLKMLGNGTAGMILDGPWQSTNPSITALGKNLGFSVIPKFGAKKAVFLGTHYLVVYSKNSSSAKVKAALAFADYWSKHSLEMAKTGDTPAYEPVIHSAAFKKLAFQRAIAPSLKYGVLSPNFPKYHDNYLYDAIESVLRGKTSDVKGALDQAAAKMTQAAQG